MRKFIGVIFSIYALMVFIPVMLLLFPFVVLASFFGKVKGGNMIYSICRLWTDISLFMWGIFHKNIYEAPPAKDHAVIFVFNHISYIDILFIFKAFRRQHIRILGKVELKKIPIFGYIYGKGAVTVNRESEAGRTESIRILKRVLSKNISVVMAPEGTFNTTGKPLKDFYNGAFRIAVQTGTPVQPVLLLDGYDRLSYRSLFSLSPGRSRAVFLPEVLPGNDAALLKEKIYEDMEQALIRYNASWIKNK